MSVLKNTLKLVSAIGMIAATMSVQAGTCSVVASTDPDAYVSGASACGLGLPNDNNDSVADINLLGLGTEWMLLDKSDVAGDLNVLTVVGNKTGTWAVDTTNLLVDRFLLVLKSGNEAGNGSKWVWFLLDAASGPCAGNAELCGAWGVYGTGNGITRRALSHASLYGMETPEPPASVPLPAAPVLFGSGLALLGLIRRYRKNDAP